MTKKIKFYEPILEDQAEIDEATKHHKIQNYFHKNQKDENERPSKSELKRQMTILQELGEQLCEIQPNQLKKFNLREDIFDSIIEAQQIKSFNAKRRQMQFIGKLMRTLSEEESQEIQNNFGLLSKGLLK